MLTGDKVDTAYNIGLSCNLISTEMEIFKIQGEKGDKLSKLQEEFKKFLNKNSYSNPTSIAYSILIDHITLTSVLESKEQTTMFLDIAYGASSVLCCRVSPKQKSQVVKMVKHYDAQAVTLAIGDGGNDVPMITEAHIGIGLCGEEGKQAVNSGDYALGEFKVLRRLLMFHGRSNNIRVSKMILYFFYKNFVFTIVHFYFAFYNNFSGQTIIDDWFITFYNMIFTAFPLCCLSIIDFDLRPDDGKVIDSLLPFLYKENRDKPIFNILSFSLSLFRGIIHGLINFFFIVYTFGVDNTDDKGNYADLWFISVALFTNIIFVRYTI
jgi:magnesium-transporting ATPase (P-type)